MAKRDFFRLNDRVTVHNLMAAFGKPVPGRVICTNCKSKYGLSVIVLADIGESEMIESFTPKGRKYIKENRTHITLGRPEAGHEG